MTETTSEKLREAVSKRIRGLLDKTVENGATEAEAMSAAVKARELMDKYRLGMTDVQIQAEPVEITDVDSSYVGTAPVDYCTPGISRYCGVKIWFQRQPSGPRKVRILGLKPDAEMAGWLYTMLQGTFNVESRVYAKTSEWASLPNSERRNASRAFVLGMSYRVNQRLIEMARAAEPVAKTATGTALVVVRNALVDEAYAKLHLRFSRGGGGLSARNGAALAAGRAAGDRVNLSRPLGSANSKRIGA